MTLAQSQALFHELLTSDAPPPAERLEACFAGTPELPAAARVAIYADMVRWRLTDALRVTFPMLASHLGEERFAALAGDYLRLHPSDHPDIGRVGRRLAAFLRLHPDPDRPDLGDLAALEWARQAVFFAPSVEPAGADALARLGPERFVEARLLLSPALRLLLLDHDAAALWRRLDAGEPADPPAAAPTAVAVWRSGFEVFHTTLPADEGAALGAAARGEPLALVCAAFAAREDAATAAHAALSSWLREGWIAGVAGQGQGGA